MTEHLGEDAELYPLGLLDEEAARKVELHIAECPACAERVAHAQSVAASLAAALPATEPSPSLERRLFAAARPPAERRSFDWRVWVAIAAALVIGFSIGTANVFRPLPSAHETATVAMVESHFNHAQFVGTGPPAKVIYARDRSWIYVIVVSNRRYDVYAVSGVQVRLIGSTQPYQTTSEVFIVRPGTLEGLQLRDGSTVVETVKVR